MKPLPRFLLRLALARLPRELQEVLLAIGEALQAEEEERAQAILATRIREQAAGRAAHEASRLAGGRK